MYVIEKEIYSQPEALKKTRDYLNSSERELLSLLGRGPFKSIVFVGCGSSYMLSLGAAALFSRRSDCKAFAVAGGELMLSPERYEKLFDGALVVIASRSGETSEVIYAMEHMRAKAKFTALGIIAKAEYSLKPALDMALELPWCFDTSVCQTRTISNLYYALCRLYCAYSQDMALLSSLDTAVSGQESHISACSELCGSVAALPWSNVTVLADGDVCGVATEGALAFSEICMFPGEYFKLLDYRHGPIVLADKNKLVIALLRSGEEKYQSAMIADIKKRGATVVTLSASEENIWGSDFNITLRGELDSAALGLPLVSVCQMIAYKKALAVGHNPDEPDGLDAYISL